MAYEHLNLARGTRFAGLPALMRGESPLPAGTAAEVSAKLKADQIGRERYAAVMAAGTASEGLRLGESSRLAAYRAREDDVAHAQAQAGARTSAAPTLVSRAELDCAVSAAIGQERARVATVFASKASHGRERVCAKLLANNAGWSASAIVAALGDMPTDAETERRDAAAKASTASAAWDGVYDRLNAK